MGRARLLPCPKVIPRKKVPGHMEAWILVADIYPTPITIESGATIWSSICIESEPMPSWPVLECARLGCDRQSLIVEVGGYWLWIVVHYSVQSPVICLNTYRSVETESLLIMQLHVVLWSVLSGTLVVLEWFNFKLPTCFSRHQTCC